MHLTQIAIDLLSQLGYGGLAAGLVLDSFGVPLPSEVLLVLGGTLSASGRFNVWAVFTIGTLAQLAGGLIGYALGRYGGLPLLERYGKYVLISKRDLARTHAAFEKYGPWMTMLGRCLPVVRGLIAYPAGIAGMRLDRFIIYTTLGSAVWSALFVWIGFTVGGNLTQIEQQMGRLSIFVVVLGVAVVLWHFREPLQRWWARGKTDKGDRQV
ncbi:MAG TPA: DedA family protein [Candidatus Saccharimonadia bacterium]|nr:DedA family protein [Candidatus Saccharimonadia bacterium]